MFEIQDAAKAAFKASPGLYPIVNGIVRDEDEWLEVVNMLFNGVYLDEKATEALLGYDWDVLENKIIEKFYE